MAWEPLGKTADDSPELTRKSRILVDESLGVEAATYLREQGYNVEFVRDVGLGGHDDNDVFVYAWRHKRMIWTHDRDFLDDTRFPEHRNPGVVVLPGGDGNQEAMWTGILAAMAVFGTAPTVWQKAKSTISPTGEITIRKRNPQTGKMETDRFRSNKQGFAERWV